MIEDLWYKNAVIYSLDVDAFMDANGAGIGDLTRLMRRLKYLHALGITSIWLGAFRARRTRTTATTSPSFSVSIRGMAWEAISWNA